MIATKRTPLSFAAFLAAPLALLALLLAPPPAFAAGNPVTLYDTTGAPLGTSANALYVTGGTGGSGGGGSANAATTSNGSDGQATSATNQQNVVFPYLFNGSTFDRLRGTGGSLSAFLSAPLPAGTNAIGSVTVSNFPGTQAVSAASLPLPAGAATSALQSNVQAAPGTATATAITVQGVAGGIAQPVSNGGTFSVQNTAATPTGANVIGGVTQSGTWNVVNSAGSAIMGKVGIDQTTPGTTNGSTAVGNSNLAVAQVSVAATATQIVAARAARGAVTIENFGTTAIYVGGSGVTATTGQLLPGVVGASITIPTSGAVYGITASGTQTVGELETY